MIPASFDYQKATSLEEALSLLAQGEEETKVLAGGHSLLPVMKLRLATPKKLVDIGQIAELQYIQESGDIISIGALTTHTQIAESAIIQEKAPALAEAAQQIGDVQVRNMGTIGGSLAHADPAADYPGAVLALDAEIVVQSSGGKRTLKANEFFVDLYATALEENELVVAIQIPINAANQNSCYLKFPNPASRFPIVGCGVALEKDGDTCKALRVGFSGTGYAAFRDDAIETALQGKALTSQTISEGTALATQGKDVLKDQSASEEYRRHLAKVFSQRAITKVNR